MPNFSPDLPAILTTIFGKLSLDGEIKLIDLNSHTSLSYSFLDQNLESNVFESF